MNFNFSDAPEYDLNTQLIKEVINLYGIPTKFLLVDKINIDDLVFGDYSHIKSDNTKIYDIYMLPENSEGYDSSEAGFGQFGLNNFDNISLFVSKEEIFDNIPQLSLTGNKIGGITGNIIILPNNKIMEITSSDWSTPGINNMFVNSSNKSVIKITCKPYDAKLIHEMAPADISVDPDVPYETLDGYFQELINTADSQNTSAEVTPSVQTIVKTGVVDTVVDKPIVDRSEDDVWGAFK